MYQQESASVPLLLGDDEIEMHVLDTDSLSVGDTNAEDAFVRRLDTRLLAFAMLGNLIKTMDNVNLESAYISGMEEELQFQDREYNWVSVYFIIGYVLMQIPSNILVTRFRPSRYLPLLEAIWCVLSLMSACVQSVRALYVLRFFLGLAEAGFYPGLVFMIGTWYSPKELGKRNSIVVICGSLGRALSGLVQSILLKTLDGAFGISGWRWMFGFDGTVTAILAWYGLSYLPDHPGDTAWLTEQERKLVKLRQSIATASSFEAKKPQLDIWQATKEMLINKYLVMFVIVWDCLCLSLGASHVLGIVAKKEGYSAVAANLFTTPDMLVTMVVTVSNGLISDIYQTRMWCIILPVIFALVGCCLLAAFVQPFTMLYFGFILAHAGLAASAPIIMTWASEIISPVASVRAISIAVMNTSSSLMYTWAPLVLWPVTDAPYYKTGFITSIGFICVCLIGVAIIGKLQQRDEGNNKRYSSTETMST